MSVTCEEEAELKTTHEHVGYHDNTRGSKVNGGGVCMSGTQSWTSRNCFECVQDWAVQFAGASRDWFEHNRAHAHTHTQTDAHNWNVGNTTSVRSLKGAGTPSMSVCVFILSVCAVLCHVHGLAQNPQLKCICPFSGVVFVFLLVYAFLPHPSQDQPHHMDV